MRPARACAIDPGAGRRERLHPPRHQRADRTREDVAGPGGRERRAVESVDGDPVAVGNDRVVALQDNDSTRPRRSRAAALASRWAEISADSQPSRRASSPAWGVSTVGALRLRSSPRSVPSAFSPSASISSGASEFGARARGRAGASGSARPRPGPSTTQADRSARSRIGADGGGAEAAADVVEADRHHLGQLRLEDRARGTRAADGGVAGAGPDRRSGEAMHGAPVRPARAADDEDVTGAELRRLGAPARRRGRERPPPITPATGSAGGPVGDPDRRDDEPTRVPLAGRDPMADLRGVEGDGQIRPHATRRRSPRVEASTPEATSQATTGAPASLDRLDRRSSRRRAGLPSKPVPKIASTIAPDPASAPGQPPLPHLVAPPSRRSRFAVGVGAETRRAARSRGTSTSWPAPRRTEAATTARHRRCCPCRRRSGSVRRRRDQLPSRGRAPAGDLHQVKRRDAALLDRPAVRPAHSGGVEERFEPGRESPRPPAYAVPAARAREHDGGGIVPRVGQRDREARRPARRRATQPARAGSSSGAGSPTTSKSSGREAAAQRLDRRLLGGEPGREVTAGTGASARRRAAHRRRTGGRRGAGRASQGPLDPIDLDQVDPERRDARARRQGVITAEVRRIAALGRLILDAEREPGDRAIAVDLAAADQEVEGVQVRPRRLDVGIGSGRCCRPDRGSARS